MQFHAILGEKSKQVFIIIYKKGLEKFKDQGHDAALGEMKQLHHRKCWQPIEPESPKGTEQKKALESFVFSAEKKSGKVKAQHCANGSAQQKWMDEDKTSSPTVMTESVPLTATIDTEEGRDVAMMDTPNTFAQMEVEETEEDGNQIIMKVCGAIVDTSAEIDPDQHAPCVMNKNGNKALHAHIIRAICEMSPSALPFCKKFGKSVEQIGFKVDLCDPCMASCMAS